ncbi:hypothetical protein L2E82_45830 [Cichorium intybus]|uniref:Uncharacterized protein n=1 Tax=Cichorium intybus TaxID=13427 RepID=A0ACB8ZT38_CICIN|nr:hypothetical protein L2E82_45830 [Cichorium intybus]
MAFYLLLSYLLPSVIQYAFTNAAGGSSWQGRKFQWINGGASTTSTIGGSAGRETKELINSLSSIQNENWVEELMDGLVGFLDVCGFTRVLYTFFGMHLLYIAWRSGSKASQKKRDGGSTRETQVWTRKNSCPPILLAKETFGGLNPSN